MPTTTAGLYEVVLEQTRFGQSFKNVFHYLATLDQDDDQDLIADAFDEDIMESLSDIQSASIIYVAIQVRNLTGLLADAVKIPAIANGSIVGSEMADFVAAPFSYIRTSKETRNGAKRFGGMVEENANSRIWTSGYFTILQATAVTLAGQISTVGIIADPVILRKPDVAGVWTYNELANVVAVDRQTTQNSRKAF